MAIDLLPDVIRADYEVHEWKHATAILYNDFRIEWQDIVDVLTSFRLRRTEIESPGGRKSPIADALDGAFYARGWTEKSFQTEVVVDKRVMNSPTHGIDCYKNQIACDLTMRRRATIQGSGRCREKCERGSRFRRRRTR